MATRRVTGTIHNNQDAIWPGTIVTFQHIAGAYSNAATYPVEATTTVADVYGQIAVDLVSGLNVAWICRIGEREQFRFNLPDGGPITIEQLRAISGTPQPAQTPLDAEAAARTAGDTALQAQINGLVIGGGGDKTYRHVQSTPASIWIVLHNLGKFVSVSVVDSTEDVVIGNVHYDSPNQVTISFSAPFGGEAYVN